MLRRGAIPSFRLDSENWQKTKTISDPKTSLVILSRAVLSGVGMHRRSDGTEPLSPGPVGMLSMFVIDLPTVVPCSTELFPAQTEMTTSGPGVTKGVGTRPRILVVDDHVDCIRPIQLFLEAIGYCVTTALSVEAALRSATKEEFDLLVSASSCSSSKICRQPSAEYKRLGLSPPSTRYSASKKGDKLSATFAGGPELFQYVHRQANCSKRSCSARLSATAFGRFASGSVIVHPDHCSD